MCHAARKIVTETKIHSVERLAARNWRYHPQDDNPRLRRPGQRARKCGAMDSAEKRSLLNFLVIWVIRQRARARPLKTGWLELTLETMTLLGFPVYDCSNESDVEQKFIYPLLNHPQFLG